MHVKTDVEIAQSARLLPVQEIGKKLGLSTDLLVPYGRDKAKIDYPVLNNAENRQDGKLVLVTAVSPTPAGEGKTTTTVGLGDALNLIGKNAAICLREPSLGPCFGMKGGAAGGPEPSCATAKARRARLHRSLGNRGSAWQQHCPAHACARGPAARGVLRAGCEACGTQRLHLASGEPGDRRGGHGPQAPGG